MKVWKEGEIDAFGVGDLVRFKKVVRVSVPTKTHIEYTTIEKGTEGIVKSLFPFIVRIADSALGSREVAWHRTIALNTEIELIKDRPNLRVVK